MDINPRVEFINNGTDNQTIKQGMDFPAVFISKKEPIFLTQSDFPDFIFNVIGIYLCHPMIEIGN